MAKNNKNKAKKVRKNPANMNSSYRKNAAKAVQLRLDAGAAAYARLLMDPCSAPLIHPVYAGSDAGYLGRFETDFLMSSIYTTSPQGAMVFSPGCISPTGSAAGTEVTAATGMNAISALGPTATTGLTDTSMAAWNTRDPALQPGSTFFAFGSEAVRCVAACLQVHYVGTELDRAGTISLGRCNAGSVVNTTTASVSRIRSLSPYVDRTPESHYEIKWCPADGDQLFTDPSLITGERQAERKNGLMLSYSGIDPSKLRVRLVAVYEWVPESGNGLVTTMESRNRSNNSLDHVLNAVDRTGRWWLKNGHHVTNTVGALYKGAAMLLGG